jgi:aryl-alcohol dehydrogenase-like predicted oxidoreductase
MKYNQIGKSELKVSQICLGTMTMGVQSNKEQSHEILDYAFSNGVNFFDTAEQYPSPSSKELYGFTEKIIGEWVAKTKNRKNIILATKMSGPGVPWIRGGGLQYDNLNIKKAVEDSLKRLNTDYIDLYQLHWPERFFKDFAFDKKIKLNENYNKIESILRTFQDLIKEGKIRYIGLSNDDLKGLKAYVDLINKNNFPEITSIQNRYNLLFRSYKPELFEFCEKNKISFLGYSPLAFGTLSGKYIDKTEFKSRLKLYPEYFNRYSGNESKKSILKYSKISKLNNLKLLDMSLSYCFQKPFLTSLIIGSTSISQLKEIIDSLYIGLDKKILGEIDSIHLENPNPTNYKEFKLVKYFKNALKLLIEGKFLDIYIKSAKFIKSITK